MTLTRLLDLSDRLVLGIIAELDRPPRPRLNLPPVQTPTKWQAR